MSLEDIYQGLDKVSTIPILPAVALKVNVLLWDPETPIERLSEIIMKDQSIVSNLLKLVNSSFYGFSSQIDTVSRAIMVLGSDTVRNAILALSTIQVLGKDDVIGDFIITDFWRHSIAVAVTSRQLAKRIPLEAPETCFVGGLLHDMGKVVMASFLKQEYTQVAAMMKSGWSFFDAEKAALPFSHALLGGYLAKRWLLPVNLVNTITHHHVPRRDIPERNLISIVHAADVIVNRCFRGSDSAPIVTGVSEAHAESIAHLVTTSPVWISELGDEIEEACEFFNITK